MAIWDWRSVQEKESFLHQKEGLRKIQALRDRPGAGGNAVAVIDQLIPGLDK